jgi:23S rRNA (pseudouridine1915-N3)-methyltransferase
VRWGVLCVGKLRSASLAAATAVYLKRLAAAAPLEIVEVKEGGGRGVPAAEAEGQRLVARIAERDRLVALEPTGSGYDTEALARRLAEWRREVPGRLWFCIGGADGLGAAVLARADERLSLSPLTLPHELARLVLVEQLYRCHALLTGHPYHH